MNQLTKREQIAAMAMQGIISDGKPETFSNELISLLAIQHADSLIAELAKGEKDTGRIMYVTDSGLQDLRTTENLGVVVWPIKDNQSKNPVRITIL